MKRIITLLLILTVVLPTMAFRVVGYLPAYRFGLVNQLDFSKLTHLCISFANPNEAGEFTFTTSITSVVAKAHEANCKVFISIGGGGLSAASEDIYRNKTDAMNRPAVINSLMNYVRENNLDGIDVDLEGSMVEMATYDGFVQEIIDSAHVEGKEVSAALAKWTGSNIDAETIEALDFLNLMSYDATGPWTINSPGQHSPMSQTKGDFSYWDNRGALKEDIVIGVPFYGYEFQDEEVPAWTWCQIVNDYPNDLDNDQITTTNGVLYYNGRSTIEEKVQYAIDEGAGGIMIWELGQDCFDENSMLTVIDDKLKENNIQLGASDLIGELDFYPNPIENFIRLKNVRNGAYSIFDLNGKQVISGEVEGSAINVVSLNSGVYFIEVQSSTTRFVARLVKK